MFSSSQLVAAAAILAVGAGVLLADTIGGPEAPPVTSTAAGVSAPAVVALDPAEYPPQEVSGTVRYGTEDAVEYDVAEVERGIFEWTTPPSVVAWESDDPRLTGEGMVVEHGVQHRGTATGLRSWRWTIETEAGSWSGTSESYAYPGHVDPGMGYIVFEGTGAYAGLSAFLQVGDELGDGIETFSGLIFPTSFPQPAEVIPGS